MGIFDKFKKKKEVKRPNLIVFEKENIDNDYAMKPVKTFLQRLAVSPISVILRGIILLCTRVMVLLTGIIIIVLTISKTDNIEM